MIIYPASLADSLDIFNWRNDELSLKMFRDQSLVDFQTHSQWYEKVLNDPNSYLFIGYVDELKVGICRFSYQPMLKWAEVSINMNPVARGRGLGHKLLLQSIQWIKENTSVAMLVAHVKKHNTASKIVFEKCFFNQVSSIDSYDVYESKIG